MSDQHALLEAIRDLPDEDLPRLAYADWLEEHSDADRAEFIRVQVALSRLPPGDPRRPPLTRREIELILTHKDAWFGPHRRLWAYYDCRRGFINEVWSAANDFLPLMDWLFEQHVLQQVRLIGSAGQLPPLLRHPLVGALRLLSVNPRTFGNSAWALPPTTAPLADRPLELELAGLGMDAAQLARVAASPQLSRLAVLDLSDNRLGPDGARVLLGHMERWPRLRVLRLSNSSGGGLPRNLGSDAIALVVGHPAMRGLRELTLAKAELGEAGVAALVDSPYLAGLEVLRLLPAGTVPSARQRQRLLARFGERLRM